MAIEGTTYKTLKTIHPDGWGKAIKWPAILTAIGGGAFGAYLGLNKLSTAKGFSKLAAEHRAALAIVGVALPILGFERITSFYVRREEANDRTANQLLDLSEDALSLLRASREIGELQRQLQEKDDEIAVLKAEAARRPAAAALRSTPPPAPPSGNLPPPVTKKKDPLQGLKKKKKDKSPAEAKAKAAGAGGKPDGRPDEADLAKKAAAGRSGLRKTGRKLF